MPSTHPPEMNVTHYPLFTPMVSDTQLFYTKVVVYALLCGVVAISGIVTNVINIVVFLRQGIFSDNGSVSLLGLAVADLCCVVTSLWTAVSMSVALADPPGLNWVPYDVWYLTAAWPHLLSAQISRGVTAYVAFERCICVVVPFKAKSIVTPRRSVVIIGSIFVCFILSNSPIFVTQNLKYRFDPETNASKLMLVSSSDWRLAVDAMFYVNSIMFNVGAVVIVLLCTMVTVSRVQLSKVWRESLKTETSSHQSVAPQSKPSAPDTSSNQNQMSSSKMQKEKKLVRMITQISVIFLICYIPDLTFMFMFTIDPNIRVGEKEHNLAQSMYCFTFLFETFNSSINIFVYYTMSSRYKQDLRALFGLGKSC